MSTLAAFIEAVSTGSIEVIDLTAPLSADTPIIQLPPDFGQTRPFELEEISRYDARGPAWYWNNIRTGEHTGTHFDAPNHWVTGKDLDDVASVPVARLIAAAVVLDFSAAAAADADFLLEVDDIRQWEERHGPLPVDGWLLYRTGWDARSRQPGGLHQRRRGGAAHAGDVGGMRPLGRRGVARARRRHGDRRHGRRQGAFL